MELFKIGFLSIGLVDIIDIAVVGLVAYKLLMMLRGTRGAPMLMGLGIILMASVIAQLFQLKALNWIISSIGRPVWLIALVILFQADGYRRDWFFLCFRHLRAPPGPER